METKCLCSRFAQENCHQKRWPKPPCFSAFRQARLEEVNLCVYTGLGLPSTYGTVGTEYGLVATWDEDGLPIVLKSATQMPSMPQLDSIWFEIPETSTNDSLGFIWTAFTDPEGFGDAYRWASKREGKDPDFHYRWEVSLTTLLWMGGHSHL